MNWGSPLQVFVVLLIPFILGSTTYWISWSAWRDEVRRRRRAERALSKLGISPGEDLETLAEIRDEIQDARALRRPA